MNHHIHIVAFDNPYPPNYGGAIDVFYKIKALYELGVRIQLHLFVKERTDLGPLKIYCETIYVYPQKSVFFNLFSNVPTRLLVRQNKLLEERLIDAKAPILFEGLHTTNALRLLQLKSKTLVRTHNIEHHYMQGLSASSGLFFKRIIYRLEAKKLKAYERILHKADHILSLSKSDVTYFKANYDASVSMLPVCHGLEETTSQNGFGNYAIFHGDLSTADNVRAVLFLMEVFKDLEWPLVIASSDISNQLKAKINAQTNVSWSYIKNQEHLSKLIAEAHINVLCSFQKSGTKLKVFYALYQGRHCLINSNIVDDDKIVALCEVAETITAYRQKVKLLFQQEFELTPERKAVLKDYKTSKVIEALVEILKD